MLLEKQPHGPYFLGGYSSGGMYSLEMATMLQNAGKEVALLVMIDTYTWISKERSNLHQFLDMFEEVDLKAESLQVPRLQCVSNLMSRENLLKCQKS